MKIMTLLRISWLLPWAWLDALRLKNQPFEKKYRALQKWMRRVLFSLGFTLEVSGLSNIPEDQSVLFVSNHQGTLDPALIIVSCPIPMTFVSKTSNGKLPVLGRWIKIMEVILFNREDRTSNIHMLREAVRYLKEGKNLLIFPEGTRSRSEQMNEFKVGATQPAYLAKAVIVPVTLNNSFSIDQKKSKLKQLKITYGEAISYSEYKDYTQTEIADYLYEKINYYIEKQ